MIILVPKKKKDRIDRPEFKTPDAFTGHAWTTTPFFKEGNWYVTIKPGFINGVDPSVPRAMEDADAEAAAKKKDVPATKFSSTGQRISGTEINLLDKPMIKIRLSDIYDPRDGIAQSDGTIKHEVIPEFIYAMGVKKGVALSSDAVNASNFDDPTTAANLLDQTLSSGAGPSLSKCDVWISQARITNKLFVDIPGNIVTGQLVDYTVGIDTATLQGVGARARIVIGPYVPPAPVSPGFDQRLGGSYGDNGEDQILVSTIYWISPPDSAGKSFTETDDEGNPRWSAFVKHNLFYNLTYKPKNLVPQNNNQPGIDPFLAWFVGRYTFAGGIAGAVTAISDQVLTALWNDSNGEGAFWTA
jgi:hypothetical protein